MKLKYFNNIDPSHVKDYYDCQIVNNRLELKLDLNFQENSIDTQRLNIVNDFLEQLDAKLSETMTLIAQDYDSIDDDNTAKFYLEHHLDILNEEESISLFGTTTVTKELFLSKLLVKRIGFYPDEDESFVVVDVSFENAISDYLIAVMFDENLKFSFMSMES
ncbi:hypothetical protein DOJK_00442 [Patescibacteria group bacterium]|nr:hypothetical protein DOJK_00442 [Patescibacteria group bacterium]